MSPTLLWTDNLRHENHLNVDCPGVGQVDNQRHENHLYVDCPGVGQVARGLRTRNVRSNIPRPCAEIKPYRVHPRFFRAWTWILHRVHRILLFAAENIARSGHSVFGHLFLLLSILCLCFICVGEGDHLTQVLQRCWLWVEIRHPAPSHTSQG